MEARTKNQIQKLLSIMSWANFTNTYAGDESVYGKCREAIVEIVEHECHVNIRDYDWTKDGTKTWMENLEDVIKRAIETERPITVEQMIDELRNLKVPVMLQGEEIYIIESSDDNHNWFDKKGEHRNVLWINPTLQQIAKRAGGTFQWRFSILPSWCIVFVKGVTK